MRPSVFKASGEMAAIVATLFLVSCVTDVKVVGADPDNVPKPTVLSFHPQMGGHGATRAETFDGTWGEFADFFSPADKAGDDVFGDDTPSDPDDDGYGREADRKISTFRVLVFYGEDNEQGDEGDLVFWQGQYANHLFEWDDEEPVDEENTPPFQFELPTGKYDFMFVANDQNLFGNVGTTGAGGSKDKDATAGNCIDIDTIQEAMFTFDREIANDEDIPMVTWIETVNVELGRISFTDTKGRYVQKGQTATLTGTWKVWMERAAIRLSLGLHMGAEQYTAWKNYHGGQPLLYIEGLQEKGFVYPEIENALAAYKLATQSIEASTADYDTPTAVKPGKIIVDQNGGAEVFFDRLIYPEHLIADADEKKPEAALRAVLRFDYGGELVEKQIPIHAPDASTSSLGYSLPRNVWVWTRAEVKTDVHYVTRVVPWGDGALDPTKIPQWNLTTDRSEFLFEHTESSDRMEVFTDYPTGWVANMTPADNAWITLDPPLAEDPNTPGATTIVEVMVSENTTGKIRTGTIVLTAGNLTRRVVLTQLPSGGITDDPAPPTSPPTWEHSGSRRSTASG